jgi:hypothetical protein
MYIVQCTVHTVLYTLYLTFEMFRKPANVLFFVRLKAMASYFGSIYVQ